jgi:hypothetical protein
MKELKSENQRYKIENNGNISNLTIPGATTGDRPGHPLSVRQCPGTGVHAAGENPINRRFNVHRKLENNGFWGHWLLQGESASR